MHAPPVRLYFDFVDPLCFVAALRHEARSDARYQGDVEWVGFELVAPPAPLTDQADPFWAGRLEAATKSATGLDVRLTPPALVPWSRKAHELHLFAAEHGRAPAVRRAIFDAYFRDGRDIGRVDVLVEVAAEAGMDRTETKAVLDVDRYQEDVTAARRRATELGVTEVPSHSLAGQVRRGFPDPSALGTLLPDE